MVSHHDYNLEITDSDASTAQYPEREDIALVCRMNYDILILKWNQLLSLKRNDYLHV